MDNLKALRLSIWVLLVFPAVVFSSPRPASKIVTPIGITLRSDIATRKNAAFDFLLKRWQKRYGTKAVDPLFEIASDLSTSDTDRYVALMGAAKLGGYGTVTRVSRFLSDPSWMLRTGSLRLLSAFKDERSSKAVLPLLKDPALVVRLEAVTAITKLRPPGAIDALVTTALDTSNYHGGKALWVPHRAIQALVDLEARESLPRLRPLLDRGSDPSLQKRIVDAFDRLSGRGAPIPTSLPARVAEWKSELQSDETPSSAGHPEKAPLRKIVTIE